MNRAKVLLQNFRNEVEDEDGEGEARVGHGYVEGEPDLGVAGEWRRRRRRRGRLRRFPGFSGGGGAEHVLPRWSSRGGGGVRVGVGNERHLEMEI